MLSSTLFVVVSCSPMDAQDLGGGAENGATPALQGPLPFNAIQANGVNGPTDSVAASTAAVSPQGFQPALLPISVGPLRVSFTAIGSAVYNDNIYFNSGHKTADEIVTIIPRVIVTNGENSPGRETWLAVEYAPQYARFVHRTANDALDQNASLIFEWRPAEWILGAQQLYQTSSGPVAEAAARATRTIYVTDLYAKYAYSPKTSFELDADQYLSDFDHPLFGSTLRTITARATYAITPKIDLGLEAQGGVVDVTGGAEQTYQQAVVEAHYTYSDKTDLRASAGLDVHEFASGVDAHAEPVFALEYRYAPTATTRIQLDGYRREENSIVALNQNYVLTGAALDLSQDLLGHLRLDVAAGINHSDYYVTAPGLTAQTGYNYYFVRPALDFHLGGPAIFELFYQYQENWSSPVNAFTNNILGVDFGFKF